LSDTRPDHSIIDDSGVLTKSSITSIAKKKG